LKVKTMLRKHACLLALAAVLAVGAVLVFGLDVHAVHAGAAEFVGAMTTLAANKPRTYEGHHRIEENAYPSIASDITYEGAAVGMNNAAGTVGPLGTSSCVRFIGFAGAKCDNSAGAASALNVDVVSQGHVVLPVTGAVITDVGLPVYATDDDTFAFSPVSGYFVGYVHRWISAGVALVGFDADWVDPYLGFTHVLKSANYTVTAADDGKWIWVDTDAVVLTLPAVDGIMLRVGNLAAYGVSGVAISPAAADLITGPGITAADNKDLINTKATAQRGDWAEISIGDADGWMASGLRGIWAREA
jgi:hypothetical protein